MGDRGRKSQAHLSVVPIAGAIRQLRPPEGLTESEQSLFRQVVAECSGDHFTPSDAPLVAAYVASGIASDVGAIDLVVAVGVPTVGSRSQCARHEQVAAGVPDDGHACDEAPALPALSF